VGNSKLVTLGRFELQVNGRPVPPLRTQKARAVTAYLVFHRGRDVSRERLLELFWPEFEEDRAKEILRTTLSTIRRALRDADAEPSGILIADKSIVRWDGETDLDADEFLRLANATGVSELHEAEALYGGDFLEGNYEEWAVAERERLTQAYERVLSQLVKLADDTDAARKLLARNPYAEEAYAALIEAELKAHRNAAAQALVLQCYRALAEAGGKPSPEFCARFDSAAALSEIAEPELVLPFVGRVHELQLLGATFASQGAQRPLLLVGEAGIGKTAILREAIDLARRAGRQPQVLSCGHGAVDGIGVWKVFYEQLTGSSMDDAAATPDIATYIAQRMVAALSASSALFFDDAHALRGDALATLLYLAGLACDAGHSVVVAVRTEGGDVLSALSAHPCRIIEVGPLAHADVDAGLANALRGDVGDLARVLFERSGGHPLFLISLLKSLADKRSIQQRNGRWQLIRKPEDALELPRDLRSSVEARLRDAGDDAAVVACAVALESSATVDEIAAALEYDPRRVLDAIDELLAFSLVAENRVAGNIRFVHDVVREVASGVLNIGRRVALHRAFARCFESRSDVQSKLRLGEHLRAAGMIAAAVEAFACAAELALSGRGFRDASEWAGDALALAARTPSSNLENSVLARLHRVRAHAAGQMGDFDSAFASIDESVHYARSAAGHRELLDALLFRAALKGLSGDAVQQNGDASQALEIAAEYGERWAAARANLYAARAARLVGNLSDAIAHARRASEISEHAGDPIVFFAACEELVWSSIAAWDFANARNALAKARDAAEQAGPIAQVRFFCISGLYSQLTGERERAWNWVREAQERLQLLPQASDRMRPHPDYLLALVPFTVSYTAAFIAFAQARWDESLAYIESCRREYEIHMQGVHTAMDVVEILARLSRRTPDDVERARELAASLGPESALTSLTVSIADAHLARMFVYALQRDNGVRVLRRCLDVIEERAHRTPLDADRLFAQLSDVAQACGATAIAKRAEARSVFYGAARTAAVANTLGAG
jgi:DNA-binding SARP family transcriptional activator